MIGLPLWLFIVLCVILYAFVGLVGCGINRGIKPATLNAKGEQDDYFIEKMWIWWPLVAAICIALAPVALIAIIGFGIFWLGQHGIFEPTRKWSYRVFGKDTNASE